MDPTDGQILCSATFVYKMQCQRNDVRRPVAQRRNLEFHLVEPEVQVLAKFLSPGSSSSRSTFVAIIIRALTRAISFDPMRSNSPDSSTRNNFACCAKPSTSISSSKMVPSLAAANLPSVVLSALVNAPFHVPEQLAVDQLTGQSPARRRSRTACRGGRTRSCQNSGERRFAGTRLSHQQDREVPSRQPVRDYRSTRTKRRRVRFEAVCFRLQNFSTAWQCRLNRCLTEVCRRQPVGESAQ